MPDMVVVPAGCRVLGYAWYNSILGIIEKVDVES